MIDNLQTRIARVLVASTHPELTATKVDELIAYGVGMSTAALVVEECKTWEREQYPIRWAVDLEDEPPAPIRNTWGGR